LVRKVLEDRQTPECSHTRYRGCEAEEPWFLVELGERVLLCPFHERGSIMPVGIRETVTPSSSPQASRPARSAYGFLNGLVCKHPPLGRSAVCRNPYLA